LSFDLFDQIEINRRIRERFSVSVFKWWSDPPQNAAACVSLSKPTMSKSRTVDASASEPEPLEPVWAAAARSAVFSPRRF
jgi:hypothetical protein